jgi:hypothetical protein
MFEKNVLQKFYPENIFRYLDEILITTRSKNCYVKITGKVIQTVFKHKLHGKSA